MKPKKQKKKKNETPKTSKQEIHNALNIAFLGIFVPSSSPSLWGGPRYHISARACAPEHIKEKSH